MLETGLTFDGIICIDRLVIEFCFKLHIFHLKQGLMGEMIYAPYDITGIKFLWWTWHDTDAPIFHRLLGVPIGSTVWVITFTAAFQFFVTLTIKDQSCWFKQLCGLLCTSLLSTPLMMIEMALLQAISFDTQGMPSLKSLVAVLVLFLFLIGTKWSHRQLEKRQGNVAFGHSCNFINF